MKSLIYTQNTTPTPFSDGTPLPLGNIKRRYGKQINSDGTTITAVGAGYYEIDVDATVLTTAAGNVILSILQNGTVVDQTTETIGADGNGSIDLGAIIRNYCYAPASNIQVLVSGTAAPTVQRLGVRVKEV